MQNINRLIIQKSRIECLNGIVYIGCKRECKAVFLNLEQKQK